MDWETYSLRHRFLRIGVPGRSSRRTSDRLTRERTLIAGPLSYGVPRPRNEFPSCLESPVTDLPCDQCRCSTSYKVDVGHGTHVPCESRMSVRDGPYSRELQSVGILRPRYERGKFVFLRPRRSQLWTSSSVPPTSGRDSGVGRARRGPYEKVRHPPTVLGEPPLLPRRRVHLQDLHVRLDGPGPGALARERRVLGRDRRTQVQLGRPTPTVCPPVTPLWSSSAGRWVAGGEGSQRVRRSCPVPVVTTPT